MADKSRGRDEAAVEVVDPKLKAELKRLALLFLISAITLWLVVVYAVLRAIDSGLFPDIVWFMWGAAIFSGCIATYFYGLYVTLRARAWGWVLLCAVPVIGSVPGCVAYSWIRRGQLERQVLEEERD
jgi:hypothetical protein